jgi:hypothetical protein
VACEARTTSVGAYDAPVTMGHAVDASEITPQAVTIFGPVPVFAALTGYASDETSATQASQVPLYTPYDSTDPAWWDNLVAEQSQARTRRLLFPTRGVNSLDPSNTSGPGDMNPRRLSAWVDAVMRAGSGNLFEAGCYVDTPFMAELSATFHGSADGTPFDLSNQSDWNDVFWLRAIKPWFDTVPSSFWWTASDNTPGGRGPTVIQFAALDTARFQNINGNASQLLGFIAQQFQSAYGSAPVFVLDQSWFSLDASVMMLTDVIGNSPSFSPPATPNAFTSYQNRSFGTAVPGFTDPSYDDPSNPNYHSISLVIARETTNADGSSENTLESGLVAATNTNSVTLLQSFTDYDDSSGFYRSAAWDFPNQYLNLTRRYSDLRTVTLQLEAEGCDSFNDTTPGNSGGAFRRSGDLDVRTLTSGSGWAVTDTVAGEWLEFRDVDFSAGNYEFIANYSTTDGATQSSAPQKHLQIAVDGTKLLPALVPGTQSADSFNAMYLGQTTLTHGPHTLRLTFLDGNVDLDWLFLKKTDPLITLQTSGGTFVSAIVGGNDVLDGSIVKASIYENFSIDDLNGGALENGDRVALQTYDGYYVTADPASGMVTTGARAPDDTTTFTIVIVDAADAGNQLTSGQSIALLTADGAHYLTVGTDPNEQLDASGSSIGPAQTFVIGLSPQSPQ